MKSILIIATIVLAWNQLLANGEPRFNERNVCNKTITVKRDKRIEEPISYQIPYNTICDLFRTCVKYRTETRINSRKVTVWEEKVIPTCCPGYAEHSDQSCSPICVDGCRNGKCVAPNQCKCEISPTESKPGYNGNTCSRFVCFDENKWGPECKSDCNCSPNAFCHAYTGKCICRTNWRGPNCTEACQSSSDPGCDEFTLLQISDPEANIIPTDDISPRSSALQLDLQSQPSSGLTGGNPSEATNNIQFALTQTSMNIILLFITFTLIFSLVRYRQRLEKITNELYYSATSSSSDSSSRSGGSAIYSEPSNYSEPSSRGSIAAAMQRRPLVPTPQDSEASQLSKNLSFASATRNIIKGVTTTDSESTGRVETSKDGGLRGKFLLDPLVESRLARSQDKSTQNVYCQPEQHIHHNSDKLNEFPTLNIDTNPGSINNAQSSDGHYQVPKSPIVRSSNSIETQTHANNEPLVKANHLKSHNITTSNPPHLHPQYSINLDSEPVEDDDSNIYEEIHPRTSRDSDRK